LPQSRRAAEDGKHFLKDFASLRLCVACLFFVTGIGLVSAQRPSDYFVYIGSYTNTTSKGIYVADFDSKSGALSAPRLVAGSVSPAQLWVAPNGRFLYAANWQGSTDPTPANTISAYAIDRRTGGLTFINKVSSGGLGPNQVVVDPGGQVAVAVNYRSGSVAAFGIERDGNISEPFYIDQHEGQPQPPSKQPGPRAHGVVFSSDSRLRTWPTSGSIAYTAIASMRRSGRWHRSIRRT